MNVIDETGEIVRYPDRENLFSDVVQVEAAREHRRIIMTELCDRMLISRAMCTRCSGSS